jgi:hypothetical protein
MALAALLFVFFITVVAIALAVFPPHRIAEWMASGDKNKKK